MAVAYGFGDVRQFDILLAVEVGYGAGYLQDAAVGAGREVETGHGGLQHTVCLLVEDAVLVEHTVGHLRIAVHKVRVLIALRLYLTGGNDTLAYLGRRFAGLRRRQFAVLQICDFALNIATLQ